MVDWSFGRFGNDKICRNQPSIVMSSPAQIIWHGLLILVLQRQTVNPQSAKLMFILLFNCKLRPQCHGIHQLGHRNYTISVLIDTNGYDLSLSRSQLIFSMLIYRLVIREENCNCQFFALSLE